ncbi:MAG: hypothetical protein IKR11_06835 [Solobacterium sp.]|nr:hypothetical protein [Solobacterium sp.]
MDIPIHEKPACSYTFDRLNMLWEKYPQHHERTVFSTLDTLLEEHESFQKDFEDVKEEYISNHYDKFLVQLSWSDLFYRYATKEFIQNAEPLTPNPYIEAFMDQFRNIDTDHNACFLFPESYVSQFFVVMEVCKRAESIRPIKNLFPDEDKMHYLAVFDKQNMDDVLLMYHLLYKNASEDVYGGYSLYEYSFPWYQNHLWKDEIVFRSPYLPDTIAKYQGNLPYYHNPSKTVYVRRNIEHILECGYISSELEFFLHLTRTIMPFFHWLYQDIALYEEKDGFRTNWRLARTKIRTDLTAEGIIKPKWKNELTLFYAVRKRYPDTLYQYRPDWLGLQSLDLYIPSLQTAIEFQGIQHYHPVEFFGGEEALSLRQQLDLQKKQLCEENNVRLVEWSYTTPPTDTNIRKLLSKK